MKDKTVTHLIGVFLLLQLILLAMQITNSLRLHNQVNRLNIINTQREELYKQEKELTILHQKKLIELDSLIDELEELAGVE